MADNYTTLSPPSTNDDETSAPGSEATVATMESHKGFRRLIVDGETLITLDEAVASAATGDLLLFESFSGMGCCISLGSLTKWSHAAIVVLLDPEDPLINQDARTCPLVRGVNMAPAPRSGQTPLPFILESVRHSEGIVDAITGRENRPGPQLVDMRKRLMSHFDEVPSGDLVIRRMSMPNGLRTSNGRLSEPSESKLRDFMHLVSTYGYESNMLALVDSLLKIFCCTSLTRKEAFDSHEYFCSELVADAYTVIDAIVPDRNAGYYTVKDFVERKTQNPTHAQPVLFSDGFSLASAVGIVPEGTIEDDRVDSGERIAEIMESLGLD
jgi:hypothetical protein